MRVGTGLQCFLVLFSGALSSMSGTAWASDAHTLKVGELTRTYLVYRPHKLTKTAAVPLVIMLHGGFGSGAQAERSYGWDPQADLHGFVVAYPDGQNHAWNAGGTCCGRPLRENVDDLGFLSHLIDKLVQDENIDPKRVYLTGMSNGSAMAYRYVCSGTTPHVAAIGTVAGAMSAPCTQLYPVSLMEIHGLEDQHIPMKGGEGTRAMVRGMVWTPVAEGVGKFRTAASCPQAQAERKGATTLESSKCAGGVTVALATIEGAGHQWPGSFRRGVVGQMLGADPVSQAMDATAELWKFFAAAPKSQ